jgi:uncharacterized protein YajQ (UPF0234 family)
MPSFDIVSKVDFQEVDNALNQASKELGQRFDFKGSDTSIELKEQAFVVESTDDFKVRAAIEVLHAKLAKRGVSLAALDPGPIEPAGGGRARQVLKIKCGVDTDTARALVKSIKDTKIKVQSAIQGETVRVTGKKRDDLQAVIQHVKQGSFGRPLQFENFRD